MKKFAAMFLLAGTAAAQTSDPSRAIEFLRELKANKPAFDIDLESEQLRSYPPPPSMSYPKTDVKNWVKYYAGEKFKFKIVHNLEPVDGFNFEITQAFCQLAHVTPTGLDFGSETIQQGWVPPEPALSYGQTGSIQSEKKACVNGFVCGYEVVIKEIADSPDGRMTFGPYALSGNKGPLYDCFLEVTDKLQ